MFQRKRIYLVLGILVNYTIAVKPPGYVEKPKEPDPNPPKYEYGYAVANHEDAGSQGHKETRDGVNTKGNYYVNLPSGLANSDVQYIADDWGYHPVVRYATKDDHSHASGHFALGHEAVQALHLNPAHQNVVPSNFIQLQTDQYPSPEALQLVSVPQVKDPGSEQLGTPFPSNHRPYSNDDPFNSNKRDPKVTRVHPVQEPQLDNLPDQSINGQNYPHDNNPSGLTKLLETTQNLVSNKDVIDINGAIEHTPKPLFTPTINDQYNAASNGQRHALELDAKQQQSDDESDKFSSPIVVADENAVSEKPSELINIVPYVEYLPRHPKQRPEKQINVEIIDQNNGQFLKETTHYEVQNNQYLEQNDDQKLMDSIVLPQKEAPSRQFLRNFKGNKILSPSQDNTAIYSTTSSTTQTTSKSYTQEEISVTQSPISNKFLAPIQAGLRLSNEGKNIEDCLDLVQKQPLVSHSGAEAVDGKTTIVEVQKSLNIKNILISQEEEKPKQVIYQQPVFGARFIPKKSKIIQQNVYIDRPYPVEVNKYIERPVRVEVPVPVDRIVEKPVPYPVPVERIVEKPIERIVEKTVPGPVQNVVVEKIVEKPIHHTHYQPYQVTKTERVPVPYVVEKIVDRPITVEKIVEKIVDRPVEVERIVERPYKEVVEKFIDRPYPVEVEKIVEKEVKVEVPVEKVVEKIVDRPVPVEVPVDRPYAVTVEKIVEKFVDRPVPYAVHVPYPVPYAVHVAPPKQHHTIIKTTTHDHGKNLFHLNHKKTKHVFLPNPPISPHFSSNSIHPPEISSINQQHLHLQPPVSINHHHHESTILKPIHTISNQLIPPAFHYPNLKPKPVYGVPFLGHSAKTTHLFPKLLNYDNQYAGSFDYQSHIYKDDYLGPPPSLQRYTNIWSYRQTPKFRRNINFGKSLRWEYGFRPPLIPSVEIDEHGNPINKENN
ncbi:uncharacterized protein LOC119085314 [Bradysia coprophila]|uniref:uncharacterized protein LOC119085314 n=1 Tax=Bradysia coprophila TaxID=38358 RepID=UPI00187DB9B9|nr:uncharacterized protein LOC119085314 [Bradysia coprophila]XP_037051588.1 uncharacterized protein LOC119085314 [Bradysia coprophila]